MDQVKSLADGRLALGCVYYGGGDETIEHVPSRGLLKKPFPENLPTVPSCRACNNGFSMDEQYVACLLGVARAGTTDPDDIDDEQTSKALRRSPALRARLESAKRELNGVTHFDVERDRFTRVLVKLARGHAAFELSAVRRDQPSVVWWQPLTTMSEQARDAFEAPHFAELLGEVGSRQLNRDFVATIVLESAEGHEISVACLVNDWTDVQDGRYRYLAVHDQGVSIRIVIDEYLACEVAWDDA
jgi:hypothetical protein